MIKDSSTKPDIRDGWERPNRPPRPNPQPQPPPPQTKPQNNSR